MPTLRRLLVGEASLALAMGATGTVYMLFVARELGFPAGELGRVNATFRVAALGMGLLGTLLAGAVATRFSARLVILLGGVTVSLVGAALYWIAARDSSDVR